MTLSYNMYMFTLLDFFLFWRKKNNAMLEFNRASAVSKEDILIVHYKYAKIFLSFKFS